MKFLLKHWFISLAGLLFFIGVEIYLVIYLVSLIPPPSQRLIQNAESDFHTYTGKQWPADSVLLSIGDTRDPGSFRGGGAYHLIFKTDSKTITSWLNTQPPWGIDSWESGPVPGKIQYNFNNFSNSNSIWHNPDYKISSLSPGRLQNPLITKSENLLRLTKSDSESPATPYRSHYNMEELQSSNIKYVAKDLGNDWWEGELFAIDTQNNIVFLSLWDIVR
jgi:hypothetical protein